MNRAAKWFWALVASQAFFLVAWAGYHEWVRQTAEVIVLKGRPADPQDLLRGDYMTMRYDISDARVREAKQGSFGNTDMGHDVWVLLEKHERYHVVVQASYEKLTPGAGQVLVRGQISPGWGGIPGRSRIDYGIERYFVPEGKGTPRFQLMEVEVSVSPAQRLYIKRVLLDGRVYPE
jgi:uncharacterized membrane-anchored protein